MYLRLFGSEKCRRCCIMKQLMYRAEMKWEFIDALAEENEMICDEFEVEELPHVQILSLDGKVMAEHIGYIDPARLKKIADRFETK